MISNLINLAKENNIDIEVFTHGLNEYTIEVLNKDLINFNITKTTSYQIKALCNNKTVIVNYENLDNPDEIIKTIISNASLIDNDNKNRLCENDYNLDKKRNSIKPDLNKIKNEIYELDELKNNYPFITNIYTGFGYFESNNSIDNAKHHMEDSYASYQIFINLTAKKNDVIKTKGVMLNGGKFDIDEIKKEVEKTINELKLLLDATSVSTNKYKVLLNNYVTAKIISNLSGVFYEKEIDMKTSPFSGKLGEKLFSDKITLLEEPLSDKFTVNKHFDSDGVLTYNKAIIENGVFKTALNNLEYAIKNNTKPTANASGTVNLHIKEGDKSFDELVSLMGNGIIIDNVEGLHAGINHQTGQISIQSSGFMVENGKITKGLDMIILQTDFRELLSNVIAVGNDMKEINLCASSVSLLLDNITISGNL